MAKKNKKNISRRNQERLRQALQSFDLAAVALFAVILISVIWGFGREYDLGRNTFHGFADWFLLVTSYPVLLLLSLVNVITGTDLDFIPGHEAVVLGSGATLTLLLVWIVVRIAAKIKNDIMTLRVAANFIRLFLFWGLFQLGCGLCMLIWSHGGASASLHRHLHRPAPPEPVTIVASPAEHK